MKRIPKNDWVNCPLTLDLPVNDSIDSVTGKYNDNYKNESDMDIAYESDIYYIQRKSEEFGHYYIIDIQENQLNYIIKQ